MSPTVCLAAKTLTAPQSGGHLWVYLNWALGLRSLGCRVIWLEGVDPYTPAAANRWYVEALKQRLEPYGLADSLALWPLYGGSLAPELLADCLDLEAAADAELLLNQFYSMPPEVVARFRRSALLDIDPGLLQVWMSTGSLPVAEHDVYFTIGETVARPGTRIPDVGVEWQYTPPCVALDWWPPHPAEPGAPFTTVSHWYGDEWMEDADGVYPNDKRDGFLPYVELPRHAAQEVELELALCLADTPEEASDQRMLRERGWRVRHSYDVTATPDAYQRYVRASRGEFSCVKPSCIRLQNAWISDRTLCYLASGKPAVVEHTGPSRFLPESAGLFRFRDLNGAVHALRTIAGDYDRQCRLARALAEEYFDARKVVGSVLERAIT